jgi:hypothetical protein
MNFALFISKLFRKIKDLYLFLEDFRNPYEKKTSTRIYSSPKHL